MLGTRLVLSLWLFDQPISIRRMSICLIRGNEPVSDKSSNIQHNAFDRFMTFWNAFFKLDRLGNLLVVISPHHSPLSEKFHLWNFDVCLYACMYICTHVYMHVCFYLYAHKILPSCCLYDFVLFVFRLSLYFLVWNNNWLLISFCWYLLW